ncbi:MAG: RNA polymerase sigma factor [Candidatus Rokubacteria bacterium]|nr:RNA polymerase sigma factor [Candidatus Rokubacteria bacterium]
MSEEPFDAIVAAHHGEIYRFLRRTTGRVSDADDLSQETFLRAFRAYPSLPPDANVRAWLFAIATNLCRNHFRSEKRRRKALAVVEADGRGAEAGGPEGETLFNEARSRVEAMVSRLPVKQRLAFTLRKLHDQDYETVGRMLDCSAESARAHVFQAFRKIRGLLNGEDLARAEARR